ncbi:MAG: circularly permuted type 2 ATP-grasp protein [Roseibium sp.]|uniref:circularly permuted type 2 ATP-grasp protein n=1 Tax=Roseibium sp. TaxID=1936156 RepID=UPI001B1D6C3D|nr:circularly permuted type 2 ATP-grasp protein [Roseibium sp.]MBO6894584.1 circularly permuted type 2 ATP-grasp protein [Roseibium sp.]MBO6928837.1 circularly permuted type 2 ATP-grasp protein [Roseibium sp.]
MSLDETATTQAKGQGLLKSYRPFPGVSDELLDAAGRVRPVWQPFIDHLSSLTPEQINDRFARGNQYLNDAGVYFRQYDQDGAHEREWPLSHIPVIISEKDWQIISEGLRQRAQLLEKVVADLYGKNELVSEGYLPASLIAQSPEWQRPLVGVEPRSGHFLHFLAFEIGRGPDGTWWVLSDRAQAPSGAGFALENRVATGRVFSEFFAKAKVHRLASFFRRFRDHLVDLQGDSNSRVSILTPGPLNDTYFEHAYIARYLGFMLLEGEDLIVQDDRLMVRTVAGLRPVSVLWRRLDTAWSDPLEFNETSQIGTAGLLQAVRHGSVSLVNALGTGILETRALLAFLPRISERILGEPLQLPNVATWWCGEADTRAYVKEHAETMMFSPALSTALPFASNQTEFIGHDFDKFHKGILETWVDTKAEKLVGQEAVTLSTTPAYQDGSLVPRPMSLRVFLARTSKGWEVMSGGFARIGRTKDASAIAMQAGGSAADVWIVGDKRPVKESLLHQTESPFFKSQTGVLPSRAADNLFWLGRYIERAEGAVRLLRAYHMRLIETADPESPLVAQTAEYLEKIGVAPEKPLPDGLCSMLQSAVASASKVRDRFSVDGWLALNDLAQSATDAQRKLKENSDVPHAMGLLLRKITGFSGLVHENMYRFTGWRFLSIGRALERAHRMTDLLSVFTAPEAPEGALELLLEVGDSAMSMSRRYAVSLSQATVLDLLAMDPQNPRAVLYQLTEMKEHVEVLPHTREFNHLSDLARSVLQVHTSLAIATPESLTPDELGELRDQIAFLSVELTDAYIR